MLLVFFLSFFFFFRGIRFGKDRIDQFPAAPFDCLISQRKSGLRCRTDHTQRWPCPWSTSPNSISFFFLHLETLVILIVILWQLIYYYSIDRLLSVQWNVNSIESRWHQRSFWSRKHVLKQCTEIVDLRSKWLRISFVVVFFGLKYWEEWVVEGGQTRSRAGQARPTVLQIVGDVKTFHDTAFVNRK